MFFKKCLQPASLIFLHLFMLTIQQKTNMHYMSKSHSISSKSSENSSLKRVKSVNDDNPQWIIKTQDAQDFSSVIEEAGDSFGSGDDLLREFEQYGIKIQNVDAKDEENDSDLRVGGHHLLPEPLCQSTAKPCQFDTVMDYSNIAKLKQQTQPKSESRVNREKMWQRVKNIEQLVLKFREFHKAVKIQIQSSISKLNQRNILQFQHYHKAVLDKISAIKQQQWKEKQKLKDEIKELQTQLNFVMKEKIQLFDTNRIKDEELKSLKSLQPSSHKDQKFRSNELLSTQSRYFATQLELEYKKQSQIMKSLNSEVQELTKEVEQLKLQNKNLKLKLREAERKFTEKNQIRTSNTDKNIQTYNKFLQRIKGLEDEINEMKKKQAQTKKAQINQWKEQIKDQLQEINQFLAVCEEKQRKILMRERSLQRKQNQARRLSSQKIRKTFEEDKEQFQFGERRSNLNKKSPQKSGMTSSLKFRLSTQPVHPYSQKIMKNSPVHNQYLYSNRPSMGSGRKEFHDKGNLIRYQSKIEDPLSLRLNKISSSIQSELNSLRCKN